jgi:hypothetical protein
MNRLDTEGNNASGSVVTSTENTRLSGFWLIMARVVWLVLVVPSLGLFVVSLPVYYQQLQSACVDVTTCNLNGSLPAQVLQSLSTIGFSVSGYAALVTILSVIIAAIWCGIGFLIFWRRSDDWLALLAAFVLVMYDITSSGNPPYALAFASPVLVLPLNIASFLGQVSLGVFFLLFPNGRLVPRWMGLILLLVIINSFLSTFPSPTSPFNTNNWPIWLNLLVNLALYGAIIFSQIYRYRRVSTPIQRQQTKWVILGVAAAIGAIIGLLVIAALIPSIDNTLFFNEVWYIIFPVSLLLIPLSIGFSILRYRLYDIDLLINRTLVYGTLTVLLALVYVGLVLGLQALVRLFPGQSSQSPVVIVASTLAIAALFQPLRRRIQAIIDRRFYRRKYDAAKITAAFGATLRNEVDLEQLREQLLAVVGETMQPSHVSLWMRQPRQTDTPSLQAHKPSPEEAGVLKEIAGHGV